MTVIQSADGKALLNVDSGSNGIYTSLLDSSGKTVEQITRNHYSLSIGIRFSAVVAGSTWVWSMWAGEGITRKIQIKNVWLKGGFDGTGAASTGVFALMRYFGAPITGGNILTPGTLHPGAAQSQVIDARVSAGAAALTSTGVILDPVSSLFLLRQPRRNTTNGEIFMQDYSIDLSPMSGLGIILGVATVIGDVLTGHIHWEEIESERA